MPALRNSIFVAAQLHDLLVSAHSAVVLGSAGLALNRTITSSPTRAGFGFGLLSMYAATVQLPLFVVCATAERHRIASKTVTEKANHPSVDIVFRHTEFTFHGSS